MEHNKKFSVEMRYKENRSLKKCQTAAKVQFLPNAVATRHFGQDSQGSQNGISNAKIFGGNKF